MAENIDISTSNQTETEYYVVYADPIKLPCRDICQAKQDIEANKGRHPKDCFVAYCTTENHCDEVDLSCLWSDSKGATSP